MSQTPPNKLESVWIQRDPNNEYYQQINISGSNLIIYHSSSGEIQADKISTFFQKYMPSGSGGAFDGQRAITRQPYTGINLNTTTIVDFLDKFFFPFNTASISINSGTTYYETGSVQNISINGTITANSETIFGTGSVKRNGIPIYTFSSASSYNTTDIGVNFDSTYISYLQVGNNGNPTVISSSGTKNIRFIYPYLWGLSTASGLSGTQLYQFINTKSISPQSNKTAYFNGSSVYMYFCFPMSNNSYTYTPLNSIKDPNNFEVINSFEFSQSVPVTSSGLANNWSTLYYVYRLKLQANPGGNFTFYHS